MLVGGAGLWKKSSRSAGRCRRCATIWCSSCTAPSRPSAASPSASAEAVRRGQHARRCWVCWRRRWASSEARPSRHAAMERGYGVAVRVDAPGGDVSDYHTAQVPPARRGQHHATRRAELDARAAGNHPVATRLPRRTRCSPWRCGRAQMRRSHWPIWRRRCSQPRFCLSIGRKSCPLGLPPGACRGAARRRAGAMAGAASAGSQNGSSASSCARGPAYWPPTSTGCLKMCGRVGLRPVATASASRDRWQFALRPERVIDLPLDSPS